MNIFPLWAYSKWWTEFPLDSPEYKKRLFDFNLMCKKCGLPVIICKNEEPVDVVFISPESVPDKEQDGGVVCAWCGTEKGAWDRFYSRLGPEPRQTGLVRVVSPRYVWSCAAGCVDTSGFVWTDCPHKRIWKAADKSVRKSGGGRMIA